MVLNSHIFIQCLYDPINRRCGANPLISTKEFLVNKENALQTIKSCIFQAGFSLVEKVGPRARDGDLPCLSQQRASIMAWCYQTITKSSRLSPLRSLILVTIYVLLFVKWQSLLIWQIQSHIVDFLSVCVATCGSAFLNVNCKVLLISN